MLEVLPPDVGQGVGFYTCERGSVIHDLLMVVDSSGGWLVPYGRAPIDLYEPAPCGVVPSFPERLCGMRRQLVRRRIVRG